jgi:hypothetical protein
MPIKDYTNLSYQHMKNKLRVGILVDSDKIANWSFTMLEEIKNSDSAEIVLVIKNAANKGDESLGFIQKLRIKRKHLVYNFYRKLDRKIFKMKPDAFERKDIKGLLTVPILDVLPRMTKYCDWIQDGDLDKIKAYQPDILIRLGFRILKGGILNLPNFGIWSYHHGDNKVNRGGPPGFWEVMNGEKETGVVLQILSDKLDDGQILYRSFSLTDKFSVNRNANTYYWKALSFIPRQLEKLYQLGEVDFFNKLQVKKDELEFYSHPLFKPPGNLYMTWLILRKLFQEVGTRLLNMFYLDQWILLYKFNVSPEVSTSLYQFKKIIPPKDRIWADPHVVYKNNKYYIFIEEMLFSENRGWISVIEMDESGNYTIPKKVLEKDTHLSYPFLIEDNGNIYMLPETKKSRSIEIYKSIEFPNKWKLERVIMDNVVAVDPTILKFENKYWLFVNKTQNEGASAHDELYIYYSESLLSNNWSSHPENPVISDVKKARPAGRPFLYKDKIYRPSQNCSNHYGYGLKINRIDILTEKSYSETIVDSINPDWDPEIKGIHTFSTSNKLTIVDGLRKTNRFV